MANDPVTGDMRHLVLALTGDEEFEFFPGQYVDVAVPGTDEVRSFSMANTSARESRRLEFIIKIYPDGLFSGFLDSRLKIGDRLTVTGPFGVFTLRDAPDSGLVFIGGGAGWRRSCACSGRWPSGASNARRCTTTARGAAPTCASKTELRALEQALPGFRYVPALSEPPGTSGRARPA